MNKDKVKTVPAAKKTRKAASAKGASKKKAKVA